MINRLNCLDALKFTSTLETERISDEKRDRGVLKCFDDWLFDWLGTVGDQHCALSRLGHCKAARIKRFVIFVFRIARLGKFLS